MALQFIYMDSELFNVHFKAGDNGRQLFEDEIVGIHGNQPERTHTMSNAPAFGWFPRQRAGLAATYSANLAIVA